jgi:uncharacterized protein YdeI (YjbR/CyaY-like superfamily)
LGCITRSIIADLLGLGLVPVRAAHESSEWQAAIDRDDPETIPADIKAALNQEPGVMEAYRDLPDPKKKRYVFWLQSTKREDAKQKRISEIMQFILGGDA